MCSYLDQVGSTYYFRRAVPQDLLGYFKTQTGKPRTDWKYSLRTKDRETAKRLLRPREIETDALIDEARRVLAALPADAAAQIGNAGAQDERAEAIAAIEAEKRARYEARRQHRVEVEKRLLLTTAEMTPQEAAWVDVMRSRGIPLETLREAVAGQAGVNRGLEAANRQERPRLDLLALFDRYAASGAANPKTVAKWRARVADLISFLGHADASRVARADLNRWIEALVAKGLSKKTIVDGYLPPVRLALGIAHDDGAIPANPAAGVRVKAPKAAKLRERELTDDEAAVILRATLGPQSVKLAEEHKLARRWVPWILAYTGARVGEITQLRGGDLRQEAGVWIVHITPEAGPVKTHEARSVPLHPHLIEQGILELAKVGSTTPLFHAKGAGNEVNPASKIRAADLAKWVRSLGVDAPAPNHGWRHRFKTQARVAEIPEYLADRIQGHAAATQGRSYGSNPLALMRDAIEKLPRYVVDAH